MLSLSKHERRSDAPFDKLRVNGGRLSGEHPVYGVEEIFRRKCLFNYGPLNNKGDGGRNR